MTDISLIALTATIAEAFVTRNKVSPSELPELIRTVHGSLAQATGQAEEPAEEIAKPTAAQIRKSITGDRLISFEDGKPYATLKRHLTRLGMTPADYRAKWDLPGDYPMTAPSYSARRSELAKQLGLGQGGRKAKAPAKGRVKGSEG